MYSVHVLINEYMYIYIYIATITGKFSSERNFENVYLLHPAGSRESIQHEWRVVRS